GSGTHRTWPSSPGTAGSTPPAGHTRRCPGSDEGSRQPGYRQRPRVGQAERWSWSWCWVLPCRFGGLGWVTGYSSSPPTGYGSGGSGSGLPGRRPRYRMAHPSQVRRGRPSDIRAALRLSVRDFAEQLGIGVRTVTKWHARGPQVSLRPATQAMLDTALESASDAAKARFTLLVQPEPPASATPPQQPRSEPTATA